MITEDSVQSLPDQYRPILPVRSVERSDGFGMTLKRIIGLHEPDMFDPFVLTDHFSGTATTVTHCTGGFFDGGHQLRSIAPFQAINHDNF